MLIERYGSVERGSVYLAFNSPHETGLAFDIGSGGLSPTSATITQQRQTPLYRWLVEHAHKYGISPYSAEPWHWEVRAPRTIWEQVVYMQIRWMALVGITGGVVGVGWLMTPKGRRMLRKVKARVTRRLAR